MREMEMQHKIAGVENAGKKMRERIAGVENVGKENAGNRPNADRS